MGFAPARLTFYAVLSGAAALLLVTEQAAAASVDCAQPLAACSACHNPLLTQQYAACPIQPWTAPPSAKAVQNPISASPKSVADGKANYGIFCEGCHGEAGDGAGPVAVKYGIPAADLTSAAVQQESAGELYWKITHGRGAMPKWADALGDDDRWQLTIFVHSLKKPR
jgi:mono/diheme cytochrome c family protein